MSESDSVAAPGVTKPASHFRWVILFLIFFATTVNYLDRMVMGILAPDLQKLYGISDFAYGKIQSAFAICYAFGQLFCGCILDLIGVRAGFAIALVAWSAASMLHALARTPLGFGIARG